MRRASAVNYNRQQAERAVMDSSTKPRMAYREVLIGILAGLDEHDEPDVQEAMFSLMDDLRDANPFDVALGAFELINCLTAELAQATGTSPNETLRTLAAAVATRPIT